VIGKDQDIFPITDHRSPITPPLSRQFVAHTANRNSKGESNLRFVSPKTHQATPSDTQRNSRAASRLSCAPEGGANQLLDFWTWTRAS
jgi:hypothetical protein